MALHTILKDNLKQVSVRSLPGLYQRYVRPYRLLLFLLAGDVLFMLLHTLHIRAPYTFLWLADSAFRLDVDGGFAEIFGYVKLALIIGLLGQLVLRPPYRALSVWLLVFTAILLDDALMLHERAGHLLGSTGLLPTLPGVGGNELGELLVWLFAGLVLGSLLFMAYRRASRDARPIMHGLFLRLGLLVLFAVGVDVAHNLVTRLYLANNLLQQDYSLVTPAIWSFTSLLELPFAPFPIPALRVAATLPMLVSLVPPTLETLAATLNLNLLFVLLEDGGEMIIISFTAFYCLRVLRAAQTTPIAPPTAYR